MTTIELTTGELRIDGEPTVLLGASVFPFRIRRAQWRTRLQAVRDLGYRAVDVYVPWNVHEPEPGRWDFDGERDIEHFLDLCSETGLLALVRPGPYICAEWDGGGLPAWLRLRPGLRLRQNEPLYLAEVERWFSVVLPKIAAHQLDRGGAVALVQLENELDFFDCDDPDGYLEALADIAVGNGIRVPLIACAGQGDLARAAGSDERIAATANIYPDDGSRDVEAHTAYYERAMRERGLPLIVPETNRLHRTLKRLVVGGARFLGPYLQTSGWNTGYGTAVNNWGDLLAFTTHDYDFGGVIAPDGRLRADAADASVLTSTVAALGRRLAAGVPAGDAVGVVHSLAVSPASLRLDGGGELLSVVNLDDADASVSVSAAGVAYDVTVPGGVCLLLVRDLPLGSATLRLSGGELLGLEQSERGSTVSLSTRSDVTVVIDVADDGSPPVVTGDLTYHRAGEVVVVRGRSGDVRIGDGGAAVHVILVPFDAHEPGDAAAELDEVATVLLATGAPAERWRTRQASGPARFLEEVGVWRGSGRYVSRLTLPDEAVGLLLEDAADVVQVRHPRFSPAWHVNSGGACFLQADAVVPSAAEIEIVARIWGHSNFDDPRLPSLRLGSFRGLSGAFAVTEIVPFSEGWRVEGGEAVAVGIRPEPRGWLGGWMTGRSPQRVRYSRVVTEGDAGAAAFRVSGGTARFDVSVDGEPRGSLTPLSPVLALGDLRIGQVIEVVVTRAWGEPVPALEHLRGSRLRDWRIEAGDVVSARDGAMRDSVLSEVGLPLSVPPGEGRWIRLEPGFSLAPKTSSDRLLTCRGDGLLITAVIGDDVVGRMWSQQPPGAMLKGGRGDYLLIPQDAMPLPIDLLVESTGSNDGSLHALTLRSGGSLA